MLLTKTVNNKLTLTTYSDLAKQEQLLIGTLKPDKKDHSSSLEVPTLVTVNTPPTGLEITVLPLMIWADK